MFFLLSLTCLLAPWDQSAIFCSNNFNGKASKLIPDETFRHGRVFNLRQKVSCRSRSWTNLPFSWYFYGASQDVFICIKLIEILLDTENKLFLLRLLQTFNLELQLLQILIEFCLFPEWIASSDSHESGGLTKFCVQQKELCCSTCLCMNQTQKFVLHF